MLHAAPSFAVSPDTVAALAGTRPAPRELRLLGDGLHSRRLVLLKSLLVRAERHGVPPTVRRNLHEHWQLLARAEARDPAAAREALGYPSVGNWLLHGLGIPLTDPAAFAEFLGGLGALAASVALRTGTGFRLTLPAPGGRLVLPGLGMYRSGASRVRAVAGPRSLRLTPGHRGTGTLLTPPYEGSAGAGWQGLLPLHGGGTLLDALDPHRAGIRPGEPGTQPLTARNARRWAARWHGALVLLEAADPERRAEVTRLVRALVPLARPADRPKGSTASGTLRSAPLAVMTELPWSAQELATVLVHEVQHTKLALLCDLTPLHRADATPAHRVPWRADPRPFDAVLQGTYAHLALADLWHRFAARSGATAAARATARAACEGYVDQVAEALGVLRASGELTAAGVQFTDGMARRAGALHRHPSFYPGCKPVTAG